MSFLWRSKNHLAPRRRPQSRQGPSQPRLEALEDRCVPALSFHFLASSFTVASTAKVATITVVLDNPSQEAIPEGTQVDYSATPSMVMQPAARPGVDFTPVSGTLFFGTGDSNPAPPPESTQTFQVPVFNAGNPPGSLINPVYYVDLTLSDPSRGTELVPPSTALLRITTTPPSVVTVTPLTLHLASNIAFFNNPVATMTDTVQNLYASSYQAQVNFGDGSATQTATVVPQGNFFNIVASHTYTQEGTFTFHVTVTPANGGPGHCRRHRHRRRVPDGPL